MKTLSDLQRYLEGQAKILADLDRYGLPDCLADGSTPDSYFVEIESSAMLADCQRKAAAFGYDMVTATASQISPMEALAQVGKMLEWAREKSQAKSNSLTVSEAAERLNISPKTIYELVGRGELNHHRAGRAIRFLASDLLEFQQRTAAHLARQNRL